MAVLQRAARQNGANPEKLPCRLPKEDAETRHEQGNALDLLRGHLRRTTLLLLPAMFSVGMTYYGAVFVSAEALFGSADGKIECLDHNAPDVSTAEFLGIFLTAFGELIGIGYSSLTIDRFGRRASLAGGLAAAASSFALAILSLRIGLQRAVFILALVLSRAFATGAFSTGFTYACIHDRVILSSSLPCFEVDEKARPQVLL